LRSGFGYTNLIKDQCFGEKETELKKDGGPPKGEVCSAGEKQTMKHVII